MDIITLLRLREATNKLLEAVRVAHPEAKEAFYAFGSTPEALAQALEEMSSEESGLPGELVEELREAVVRTGINVVVLVPFPERGKAERYLVYGTKTEVRNPPSASSPSLRA